MKFDFIPNKHELIYIQQMERQREKEKKRERERREGKQREREIHRRLGKFHEG